MEAKMDAKTEQVKIWKDFLKVSKPDCGFRWAFLELICD